MTGRTRAPALAASLALAALAAAGPARALNVVTWNLFQYPDYALAARQPVFRTVMRNIQADVLVVQEITSQAGRDSFLLNVLDVVEPGQWTGTNYFALQASPPEGGVIFWKPAKVNVSFVSTFATSGPRDVLFARVTPVGYTALAGTFRVYSVHLKAGNPSSTPSDSTTRRLECTDIRNTLNNVPAGTNFLLLGDFNFYGAWEGGYLRVTESQADNDGRSKDPLNMPGTWHTNPSYALFHTQCPCASACGAFSGGGMDDRFDLILTSQNMQDLEGVDLYPIGGYYAYGNDGAHYNNDINGGGFNNVVPLDVATALKGASDHLPVVMVVQLAPKIAAASAVDFGSVIAGATAEQPFQVQNSATAPADELNYSFASVPAGFTAPAGGFVAGVSVPGNHVLGMDTAAPGAKAGTLTITTDAPDSLSKPVQLSGTVLAHAVPSLDSLVAALEDSLDFGTHAEGGFPDLDARAHNRGWNALQARLHVSAGAITGGGGRFSVVGGFTPALIAGTGASWAVRFDAAGAPPDSTYEATLTLSTADEALPGATALDDLVVRLVARTAPGTNSVPGLPATLRFHAPRPNPASRAAAFAFDLPRDEDVALEVFDLAGRRVATLAAGRWGAGSHSLRWRMTDASGARLGAGLYFARFRAGAYRALERLVVLP